VPGKPSFRLLPSILAQTLRLWWAAFAGLPERALRRIELPYPYQAFAGRHDQLRCTPGQGQPRQFRARRLAGPGTVTVNKEHSSIRITRGILGKPFPSAFCTPPGKPPSNTMPIPKRCRHPAAGRQDKELSVLTVVPMYINK
jgi:hypothetical protein